MAILTVDNDSNDLPQVAQMVDLYKDHPALLLWMLGNEWNLNLYVGAATSVEDAARRTEEAAALIKRLDPHHPVATSYGDIMPDVVGMRLVDLARYVHEIAPSVDLWSVNIHLDNDINIVMDAWPPSVTHPLWLGEVRLLAPALPQELLRRCLEQETLQQLAGWETVRDGWGGIIVDGTALWPWGISPEAPEACGAQGAR